MIEARLKTVPWILVVLLLVAALVLPYVGGYPGAYVQMLLAIALIVWLLVSRLPLYPPREPAVLLTALAFTLMALCFVATQRSPADLGAIVNFLPFALVPPLAAALATAGAPGRSLIVANYALAGSALAFVVAVGQVLAGAGRAAGYGSDEIWSAAAAILTGYVALIGYDQRKDRWRYAYLLGPVIAIVVSILSGSRGPVLTAIVLAPLCALTHTQHRWRELGASVAQVALSVSIGLLISPSSRERLLTFWQVSNDVLAGGVIEESASVRLQLWQASLTAFWEHPWLGVGWSHRISTILPYLAPGIIDDRPQSHQHADILGFGTSAGVVGLVAYALLIATPLIAAVRSPQDSQHSARVVGCLVIGVGYLLLGLTDIMFGFEFHTMLYVSLTAIVLGLCRDESLVVRRTAVRNGAARRTPMSAS